MFAVHGDLAHVKVVYDRSTGKSMGYGFVKFTTNEAAAAATAAINGMAIERKRIKVRKRMGNEKAWGGGGGEGSNVRLSCVYFYSLKPVTRFDLLETTGHSLKCTADTHTHTFYTRARTGMYTSCLL